MVASKTAGNRPIEEIFRKEQVGSLCRTQPAVVNPTTALPEALRKLREDSGGCVIVVEEGSSADGAAASGAQLRAVGILTERDYLDKLAGKPLDPGATVAVFMTPSPKTISREECLDTAIQLMTRGGYRHLPLVDERGSLVGVLSARHIISYLASLFPVEIMNLPPRVPQSVQARDGG
ncbi:MAG TPA: CBS domain-containing protein [Planctomycetota bacterium]|nr:CBS domain-containing protein [Planctomycetota bacterium]